MATAAERRKAYKMRNAGVTVEVPCPSCGAARTVAKLKAWKARTTPCRSCAQRAYFAEHDHHTKGTGGQECAWCGGHMKKRAAARHCSMACRRASGQYERYAERLREERRGESNPNWRHGEREGIHTAHWNVVAKGERTCRVCPEPPEHLHHIVYRSAWPICPERDDLRNGMPLCGKHHRQHHNARGGVSLGDIAPEERAYIDAMAPVDAGYLARKYPASDCG